MSAILSFLVIVLAIYLLAIITDEYFIVSLDEISKRLQMPPDVAGASLMAVGSSAPELFIALVAVFRGGAHGDVGVGTIVGSAVFNILVITGMSAVVAGKLDINLKGVERDIIFYLGSIVLLLFVFWDAQIYLWEGVLLVIGYAVYIYVLWRWGENNPPEEAEATKAPEAETQAEPVTAGPLAPVNHAVSRVLGVIMGNPKERFVWAMLLSIALIAGISWVLVENAVVFAQALSIPPVIVSLTLLAAGTSAPDLIASINVARDGRGGMAVANAVGSNTFDILIGLGLPWIVSLSILGERVIEVGTSGLLISIFILGATVILLYIFLYTSRRLSRWEGWALLGVYVTYVLYAIITNQA